MENKEEVQQVVEPEVTSKVEVVKEVQPKKKKSSAPVTSFKNVDISNPTYYDSELSIYTKNEGKPIYIAYKNMRKIFYVVNNGEVRVCAIRPNK